MVLPGVWYCRSFGYCQLYYGLVCLRGLARNSGEFHYGSIFHILSIFSILSGALIMSTVCRGVRGATTVQSNSRDEILQATRQMLALMIRRNGIDSTDIASAIFTVTRDLDAEFPALAARQFGWLEVPLLCGYEIHVPGSLPMCVRVLLHWNTTKTQHEIQHVYIHDAVRLRPDLSKLPPVDWEELENWIKQNQHSGNS